MRRRDLFTGLGAALLLPSGALAQARADPQHRIDLDVPLLSEEPASVPIRVSVDHPMEPDHFIRSIEVTLEQDPVPHKGKFLFGPGNGRASVGYQMRSGAGGLARAVVECSRHGAFVATREVRVVEGGCATGPERGGRDRAGQPELRLPRSYKLGEVIEVRAKVNHASHTGLALKQGRYVRELPEYYVKQMLVYLDDQAVSEFQLTSAVSPNPLFRFPLRVIRAGTVRVVFVNNEGQRWEVAQGLRP